MSAKEANLIKAGLRFNLKHFILIVCFLVLTPGKQ